MKTYKANRKGFIRYLIIASALYPFLVIYFSEEAILQKPLMIFLMLSPFFLFSWIYLNTAYYIENGHFRYRSGLVRGNIDIRSILHIQKSKNLLTGLRPALAKGGMILKYDTSKEIYIAPEDNDELIQDLLAVKPEIEVSE